MAKEAKRLRSDRLVKPKLPTTRSELQRLVETTGRQLGLFERHIARQRMRFEHLAPSRSLQSMQNKGHLLNAISLANQSDWGREAISFDEISPYVEHGRFQELFDHRETVVRQLKDSRPQGNVTMTPKSWLKAYSALIKVDTTIMAEIQKFYHQVAKALERRLRADSKADTQKPRRVRVPQSKELLRFIRFFNREIANYSSQKETALAFTDGNEKRADSLLRQARNYQGMLKTRAN